MSISGVPPGTAIAADKVNGMLLYAVSETTLYVTTDAGTTWTASNASLNRMAVKVSVNPMRAGELWVSTSSGIAHSSNFGVMLGGLLGVTEAWALGLGIPASKAIGSGGNGRVPALYAAAANAGKTTVWHTDDNGVNWEQISGCGRGITCGCWECTPMEAKLYHTCISQQHSEETLVCIFAALCTV